MTHTLPISADRALVLVAEPASGCPHAGCDPADINGDCLVNLVDLTTLLANYQQTGVGHAGGDLDQDNIVDLADLTMLLADYGNNCN